MATVGTVGKSEIVSAMVGGVVVELKDPKNPTKRYIKSVLESEGLIPTVDAIEQCLYGWMDAVNSKNTVEKAEILQKAFSRGDLWAIGFCTYTYGYVLQPALRRQLSLF